MKVASTFPNTLYHYTTADGLLGILKEKALWATKIHYLNDASEMVEPIRIAEEYLLGRKNGSEGKDVKKMVKDLHASQGLNICVASFCEKPDILSQWRAYGSDYSSYSIGFKTNKLIESVTKHGFELCKCQYFDIVSYKEHIEQFVEAFVNQVKDKKKNYLDFTEEFFRLASTMKYDYFKNEGEYRVISKSALLADDKNFNFRPAKSIIIPYYSIPINLKSVITQIFAGPCSHPDLTKDTLIGLAWKYGLNKEYYKATSKKFKYIDIQNSKIPYRSFS